MVCSLKRFTALKQVAKNGRKSLEMSRDGDLHEPTSLQDLRTRLHDNCTG